MLMFARKTSFVGSKCLNFVIKYVSSATKLERTMNKLKPFMDNILYETDYPHPTCQHPGPRSPGTVPQQYIDETLGSLPEPTLRKVLFDNAAALYGIK